MVGLRCSQCESHTDENEINDEGHCEDCQLRDEERSYYEETEEHRTHPY